MTIRKNKKLPSYVLGLVLLALLVAISVNQGALSKTNSQAVSQKNEKQLISQGESEHCEVNSGDFLFSDCTGFYE